MIKDTPQDLALGYFPETGSLPVLTPSDSAKEHMDMAGELAQIWNPHLHAASF